MSNNPKPEVKPHSISFYVILAAALFVFIQTFSLLSPILLSFLLILLISLAFNPVISRMRAMTGGRKGATGLVAAPLVAIVDILHDELYRKRFLPTTTDADLDHLAGNALREKQSVSK